LVDLRGQFGPAISLVVAILTLLGRDDKVETNPWHKGRTICNRV